MRISWRQWEIPHGAVLLQSACGLNSPYPRTLLLKTGGHQRDLIPRFPFQRGIFTLPILPPLIPHITQPRFQTLEGNSHLRGGCCSPGNAASVPIPNPLDALIQTFSLPSLLLSNILGLFFIWERFVGLNPEM